MVTLYKGTSKATKQNYIGQAQNTKVRFATHKRRLENGTHKNYLLTEHVEKYGVEDLVFVPFLHCYNASGSMIDWLESEFITRFKGLRELGGFNIKPGGNTSRGWHHSEETKKKMSEAHIGIIFTDEHRKNMSESRKGMEFTDEHKKHMSEAHIGKKRLEFTDEHKKHMSEAHIGKKFTDEHKKNMSLSANKRWTREKAQVNDD